MADCGLAAIRPCKGIESARDERILNIIGGAVCLVPILEDGAKSQECRAVRFQPSRWNGRIRHRIGGGWLEVFSEVFSAAPPSENGLSPFSCLPKKKVLHSAVRFWHDVGFQMSIRPHSPQHEGQSPFPTTSWTLIQKVQKGSVADAARAMEEICRKYWYPIYAYARRFGFSIHDAEDMTQMFFQNLISDEAIHAVREEKGRMRTFMLTLLRNAANNKRRHDTAEKRGGNQPLIASFDDDTAENRYKHEPADKNDPELIFDRAWADELLAAAGEKLRADFVKADNLEGYDQLREFLPLGDNATPYPEVAKKLGVAEGTLRLQIHRMRKRYGKLIEDEIAQTVSDPDEIKAEVAHLMAVIGGGG